MHSFAHHAYIYLTVFASEETVHVQRYCIASNDWKVFLLEPHRPPCGIGATTIAIDSNRVAFTTINFSSQEVHSLSGLDLDNGMWLTFVSHAPLPQLPGTKTTIAYDFTRV